MHVFRGVLAVIALAVSALLLVENATAAPHQTPKPQLKPAKTHAVSYMPDGTAIATGAPRRLSPLAGNDSIAWHYAGGRPNKHVKHAATPKLARR
jgi:hypothetical protein